MGVLKRVCSSMIVLFLLAGCSTSIGPILGNDSEIPIRAIDGNLSKAFPVSRKASFGRVKILGAATVPNAGEHQLVVRGYFNLVSFEIPEGIDGLVQYTAGLRYDPNTQAFYLDKLVPRMIEFNNPSLQEYVSNAAQRSIPSLIAKSLASVPVYRMKSSARSVKEITVKKESVTVTFN